MYSMVTASAAGAEAGVVAAPVAAGDVVVAGAPEQPAMSASVTAPPRSPATRGLRIFMTSRFLASWLADPAQPVIHSYSFLTNSRRVKI